MHYIAWLIAQGGVPYRDAFDMNLPGVYLLHLAVLRVGGPGDLAWRLFDLAWLAVTGALLWAYCRPMSDAVAAGAGAVLFGLYHLSGGPWRAGQRDFLLCLFLLAGAYGVARGLEQPDGRLALLAGGLALGAGMTVKPHAGLFWLLCAAVAAAATWRAGRSAWLPATLVLGGGLVVPALVFGWLAGRGGLAPFLAILTGYVLPLYSQVGRVSVIGAMRWHAWGRATFGLLAALGLLGLRAAAGWSPRLVLAALGALYGAVHFALQGKGWEYHLYPLAFFATALGGAGLDAARQAGRRGLVAALLAALWVATGALAAKGVPSLEAAWIAEKHARALAVARALEPVVAGGGTVQVFDTTEGGIDALYRLRARQPTRFLY
ncbi:MAG TPA: glycosyltransferase family 39 protein, partial [Methylomirabilota bacterium]